ncbi:MFS transporter [Ferroacidibacillus organovorans]|uniref:MFS transporter n=1 Tax=Ferroacidibacillus organovorans TaxID=1765683 RepID=UPI000AFA4F34|nr:MFS transporter [Ferroacidibacillus organovorans]
MRFVIEKWQGIQRLNPVAKTLIQTRFLRSIAQGAMGVDFTLYLRARHWTAPEIGLLLMAGGLVGSLLSLWIGISSDRIGRRRFLLMYESGLALGTLLVIFAPSALLLAVIGGIFGFGRGANGASGPFAPAEQAWLAQVIDAKRRGSVFSANAGLQFAGMGIGSLMAGGLPHMLPIRGGAGAYLPLFILTLSVAVINSVQIYRIKEVRTQAQLSSDTDKEPPQEKQVSVARPVFPEGPHQSAHDVFSDAKLQERTVRRRENVALFRLSIVNMINSLGVGVIAPLFPYWFNVRFGVGPEAIGPVYALTFFLTAASSLLVGRLSRTYGLMRAVVIPRIAGLVLLIAIPFSAHFSIAALLYILRSIVNRSSVGARQAFGVSLVRDSRRGFASSINAISWTVPAAFGPALGGMLIGLGSLAEPFVAAFALQLAYVVLFPLLMRRYAAEAV